MNEPKAESYLVRYDRIALKWFFLRGFGAICLLHTILTLGLLVTVPALGLQNDDWAEADHFNIPSALATLVIGSLLIWLSRQTYLAQRIGLVAILLCLLAYGLLDLTDFL